MAKIKAESIINPITIDKFLGLNLSNTGDTQIQLGESGNMDNFYITNDYKLKKMYGYKCLYNFNSIVQGMHSVTMNNINYLLVATNGHLYAFNEEQLNDEDNWNNITPIDIGEIHDSPTTFFEFNKNIYILTGKEYKKWDGVTLNDVEGYIPKVYISTSYDGGGTPFEQINLLTGKKHQTFNGDGEHKTFKLAESNILSVDKVVLNAEEITTGFTVDLVEGTVTFDNAPSEAMDNIDIYWNKENEDRHFIENMRAGIIFGGGVDTKAFLYGNEEEPNRIRYSATADNVPSVEYFPGVNQIDVGPNNFEVTDLRRHYDRLLITTNKPEAYYMTLDSLDIDGMITTSLQTFPLNEVHGNVAFAQGQVIDNDPITIDKDAIIRWKSTNVRDERNMKDISQKISLDLIDLNLKVVKTIDFQIQNQLWIAINNKVYIYNYSNETFSRLNLAHEVKELQVFNGVLYMTTQEGKLMRFGEEFQTYDGEIIKSHWEMNFYDFGAEYLRKTMNRLWVLMQPQAKSSAEIGYISNRNESPIKKKIEYKLTVLNDVDFTDFSFQISNNPQPFRLKMKAKKFTNLKITIDNTEETDATILSLALRVEAGGESK